MFPKLRAPLPLLFVLCLSALSGAQSGERKIILREYLNQPWTKELVTYPFTAPAGECRRESVRLQGPRGPVPVQLSSLEYWPGTSWVKSARASFLADLSPRATDTYALRYGPAAEGTKVTDMDLQVVPQGEVVELATGQFAVRLLLGEKAYPRPAEAGGVPGPVVALRAPDGTWFGGSRLYGKTKVTGYSARVTEQGPVLAEVAMRYTYEGGSVLTLTARLAAGDSQLLWDTHSSADKAEDGWEITLNRGLGALALAWTGKFVNNKWGKLNEKRDITLDQEPAGTVVSLEPWADWWDGCTGTTWTLKAEGQGEVFKVASREPGDWVEPLAPGTLRDWGGWVHKLINLRREANGELLLQVSNAAGWRKWQIGGPQNAVGYRLNVVKDYALEWPGDAGTHPRMFLTRQEMEKAREQNRPALPKLLASLKPYWTEDPKWTPSYHECAALSAYLLSADPQVAAETDLLGRFRKVMLLPKTFDTMRSTCAVTIMYDTLIEDPLVPEQERPELRARMANLGYKLADPATWSCERGYRSYNLNMSVANVLNLGMVASAIPTHPMAKEWAQPALAMLESMLNEVGPGGEWGESVTNYTGVTVSSMLAFAIAARNAGFHDFVNDPRMKKLLLFHTKMYTPRDPRGGGQRVAGFRALPPHGRAGAGNRESLAGGMARAALQSDPQYSSYLQWAWLGEGAPTLYHDSRLGGLEYLYLDKSLPAVQPPWASDLFPLAGTVMRNGLGTGNEHQINLITGDFSHAIFASETGAFATIFSYGKPVAGSFAGGYAEREEYLMSRVCLARGLEPLEQRKGNGGYAGFPYNLEESATGKRVVKEEHHFGEKDGLATVSAFSALPRQDYTAADILMKYKRGVSWDLVQDLPPWPPVPQAGKPPVDWRRQVLFLKDDDPAGANYLLLRDTVTGGQPTMWQMWTVSDKVGTPEEAQDVAAFLKDKPGDAIVPPRELRGNRFTAVGQFDVDVEYYIATPSDTPLYTLRWGTKYNNSPIQGFSEYHDLLHLQRPDDGAYFVAFFPRKRSSEVPAFSTLGGGTIIKVSGAFGTDYGFLSALPGEGESEGVSFKGTAGSVQDRGNGLALSLGAPGEVRYQGYGLRGDAASLRVGKERLTVELPAAHARTALTLLAPGAWKLAEPARDVGLEETKAGYTLSLPAAVARVDLVRG